MFFPFWKLHVIIHFFLACMAEFLFICSYDWNASLLVLSLVTLRFFYVVMSLGAPWPITATTAGRSTPPPQAVHRSSNMDPTGSHQRHPFEHVLAVLQQCGSTTALGRGQSLSSCQAQPWRASAGRRRLRVRACVCSCVVLVWVVRVVCVCFSYSNCSFHLDVFLRHSSITV